jgi:hypothetical protein
MTGRLVVRKRPVSGFNPKGVIVIGLVHDEIIRLPYFLEYYRRFGAAGFVAFDDGSVDGSSEFLQEQDDVLLIGVEGLSFSRACGIDWINTLIGRFALNRWVLKVDIDELFYWPGSEIGGVDALVASVERTGAKAIFSPMIDVYSESPADDLR